MEGIAILILITIGVAVAALIFMIWVMYTVAKSLKEISRQQEQIAALLRELADKSHNETQEQHAQNNCWDDVFKT